MCAQIRIKIRYFFVFFLFCIVVPPQGIAQEKDVPASQHKHTGGFPSELTLRLATICEQVKDLEPENPAINPNAVLVKPYFFSIMETLTRFPFG